MDQSRLYLLEGSSLLGHKGFLGYGTAPQPLSLPSPERKGSKELLGCPEFYVSLGPRWCVISSPQGSVPCGCGVVCCLGCCVVVRFRVVLRGVGAASQRPLGQPPSWRHLKASVETLGSARG